MSQIESEQVFECVDCGDRITALERPAECANCGGVMKSVNEPRGF
ncbi:rubrerythrin-like domain-containing protein [Halobium palmae]|uniref:Rubrerythrin-like domain-containing protein n=1 Tax=Halobium palmae TaxID=1776492 RepID=A0ABD5RV06_9EURY